MKPSQLSVRLRRIASAIDLSKNPSRTLVARDLKKVLAALDQSDEFDIKSLLDEASAAGWKIADAILDINDNIYRTIILCKNMEPWEPYKGHRRSFGACDAYALGWWLDVDATEENSRGELIYDLPEDEEVLQINIPKISECSSEEAADMLENHQDEVSERIRGVIDGTLKDRWDEAPRMDQ